ncbi:hypothetical protein [Arthrobacter cryoconiti]|uniref:Uncharacterized protein n=1 Tax=Arthrobacter cryoconiti TaxID=748907 RepID=A0ABV8QZ16_9MICC|nr:hypothetical protein [Arthrobacter cryoconiti]MCC9068821.1 hypothetical protein [Arthrobacter cryoconiti]
MKSLATSTVPAYAHPVHVGADGITFRRVHGPSTKAVTGHRTAYRAWATQELARRVEEFGPATLFMPAEYLAVAR